MDICYQDKTCERWIVVTTVNPPTYAMQMFERLGEYSVDFFNKYFKGDLRRKGDTVNRF
jgi:hypothetical protein